MRIRLERVRMDFGPPERRRSVLRDLDCSFGPGITWVRGRSGCGKSTLLALAAGLQQPTAGRVLVDERELWRGSAVDVAAFRRRHVGFVFQAARMLPGLDLCDNVAVPLLFERGVDARARAREALSRFGLEDLASQRTEALSLGELQRASVARALLNAPSIVFADEPTASLDDASRRLVLDALRDAARRGATVVIASHDEREVHLDDAALELAQ
ncbi:MAG: ATP-binding cassette domain-containing protein [Planctomycetota bacterium]